MIDATKELALLNEQKKIAVELSKSTLVPQHFKNPIDAWFAIAYGTTLGFTAIYSLMNIKSIKGVPFVGAEAMLAIAKAHPEYGGMELEYDDTKASLSMVRQKANGVKDSAKASFTIEQAKQAGLLNKDNWRQWPARMLRARVIGFVCRELFADVIAGLYTVEEADEIVQDKPPAKSAKLTAVGEAIKAKASEPEPAPASEEPIEAEYEVVDEVAEIPNMVKAFGALLGDVSLISSDIDTYRERIKHAVKNKDVATIKHVIDKLAKLRDEQKTRASARPSRVDIAHDRVKKIISKQPEPEQDELLTKAIHLYNAHDADGLDALADELLKRPKPVDGLGFNDSLPPVPPAAVEGVIDAINQLLAAGYNKVHAANSIRKHFPEIGLVEESNDWQAAVLAAKVDDAYLTKMAEYYTNAAKGAAKNAAPVKDDSAEIARLVAGVDRIMTDDAVEVTPEIERLFTESTVTSLQALKAMVAAPAAQVKNINKLLKQKGLKLESFAPGYADASLLGAKLANEVEEKLKAESDF